jgi:competence protein ComEC
MQSFWHCIPLVRLLLPFLAGIALNMKLLLNSGFWLSAFVTSILLFAIFTYFGKKYINFLVGFCLVTSCFVLGGLLHCLNQQYQYKQHFSNNAARFLIVEITEQPKIKTKTIKMVVKVLATADSTFKQQIANGKLLLYVERNNTTENLSYGRVLIIPANYNQVHQPQNPNEFNYKKYLSYNQIYHQCFVGSAQLVITEIIKGYKHYQMAYQLQNYIKNMLHLYVRSEKEIGVAQALLFGYDDDVDPELKKAYGNTGTLHVLAVSGMHVGLIYLIITLLLQPVFKVKRLKWLVHVLSFTLIWCYAVLCGLSPSVMRASVMISFFILAELLNRKGNSFNTLAASAMLLLLINPNLAASVGFQLSYFAVMGIIGINPYLYNLLTLQSWLGNQIWKISCISISAQLGTFPLGLLYFHQFPLCFPISNLLIIPLISLIIYAAIVLLALGWIKPLAIAAGFILKALLTFTNTTVSRLEQLPYAYINGFSLSVTQTAVLYVSIFIGVMYFIKPFKWLLQFCICGFAMFMVLRLVQNINHSSINDVTIYHIKNHSALQLINGNKSILIADSGLLTDSDKMKFHLEQQLWHRKVNKTDTLAMLLSGVYTFNNLHIYVNAIPDKTSTKNHYTVLLVTNKQFAKYFIKHTPACNEVVINNSFSAYYQQLAALAATKQNINIRVLAKSGYVAYKIN